MKRSLYLTLTCAFAVLAMASCKDDAPTPGPVPPPEPGDPLKVTAVGEMGKFSSAGGGFCSWNEGDSFGMFWRRTGGISEVTPFTAVAGSIDNAAGSATFEGDLYWDASKQQQFFYAVSPCPAGGGIDPEHIEVSLPGVQTQTGNAPGSMAALNVMVARPATGVAPDFTRGEASSPVKMDFTPLFSLLELRLIAHNDVPVTLNSVKIESVNPETVPYSLTGAEVNITTPGIDPAFGRIEGGTSGYTMRLNLAGATLQATDETRVVSDPSLPATEEFLTAHLMMLPGNYAAGGAMLFTFDTSAGEFTVERTALSLKPGGRTVVTILVPVTPVVNTNPVWDGTVAEGPTTLDMDEKLIEIATPEELAWLAAVVNGDATVANLPANLSGYTVKLLSDMDLDGLNWTPIGKSYSLFGRIAFEGTFDGGGFTINNLRCASVAAGSNCAGLFGCIYNSPGVYDLNVNGSIELSGVTGTLYAGGLAGYINGRSATPTLVENCHVNVSLKVTSSSASPRIGGLAGNCYYSRFDKCTVSGEMEINSTAASQMYVGVFISYSSGADLINCGNYADMKLTGAFWAGGLVSYTNASVNGCAHVGDITVTPHATASISVGGLVGQFLPGANRTVSSCYNNGDITISAKSTAADYDCVSGVIAHIGSGAPAVTGCYNSGVITASGGNLDAKKGNIFASVPADLNADNVANNYYVSGPLPTDQHVSLDGKV
ncbi:MAG: fimbrillin family protein, partial [Alistipes sp.]|nr:fimbrillin family protein [Alistipes sp.]